MQTTPRNASVEEIPTSEYGQLGTEMTVVYEGLWQLAALGLAIGIGWIVAKALLTNLARRHRRRG